MLKFLSKIKYRRFIFAVIWTSLTIWLWVSAFAADVEKAKGGVVQLQTETYVFGPVLFFFLTLLFIMIIEIILSLAFDYDLDGIQRHFQHRLNMKEYQESLNAREARDRAYQERLQKEKEEMELKQFISHCLQKGKPQ